MNLEWISEKGSSLIAFLLGLVFVGLSYFDGQYRYFYLCVALIAFIYGFKQFKKRDTPFEKHERELRRRRL